MKTRLGGLLLAAGLLVAPSIATAQNPFHFNIAAGASVPTGDLADFVNVGYNLTAGIGLRPALSPLGFRLEGQYNNFGGKDCDDCDGSIKGLDVNAIYDFMPVTKTVGVSFYGIGGVGGFRSSSGDVNSDTKFGWNLGAGLRLPLSGFSGYVEARFHQVSADGGSTRWIPITFGLVF
jgi:opacity protein-like surface antigen